MEDIQLFVVTRYHFLNFTVVRVFPTEKEAVEFCDRKNKETGWNTYSWTSAPSGKESLRKLLD